MFAQDCHEEDVVFAEECLPRQGEFQHSEEGNFVIHQVTGCTKNTREHHAAKERLENKEMERMMQRYRVNQSRSVSLANARTESVRSIKGSHLRACRKDPKKATSKKAPVYQTATLCMIDEPKRATVRPFSAKRPISAVIRPWTSAVNHSNLKRPESACSGFSLTQMVTQVPKRQVFEPLDPGHLSNHNSCSVGEIEKIKKLLVRKGDIATGALMKALMYDECQPSTGMPFPQPQLLSNPFLKKKKRVVRRRRPA